jgi:predicted flap endonuclease-1-like 5' DNA nuclease
MLNPAHILEIALLLFVAFLIGATIGSVARLAAMRLLRPKVVAPPVVVNQPAVDAPASLVTAPVIEPLTKPVSPAAPAEVPAMDFTEVLLALAGDKPAGLAPIKMQSIVPPSTTEAAGPAAEMAPARAAGATTSGRPVAHPRVAAESPRAVVDTGIGADVIPFPVDRAAAEAPEVQVAAVVAEPPPVSEPEVITQVEEAAVVVVAEAEAEVERSTQVAPATAEEPAQPPAAAEIVEAAVEVAPVAVAAAPAVPAPATVPESSTEDDEAAAMRAIEGSWSPGRATPVKPRRASLPDDATSDVATAVPAVEPEVVPGRPVGIEAPRHGVKDDLTNVIGILPIIETALNRLGLYHFDQIADLSDENVGFIEVHLGIAGRVAREHWREQARELGTAVGTKRVGGKQ